MIEAILKSNEGKTLEFKENLQSLQGIVKTIIAFANTAGGVLVIGVEDKTRKVVGVDNPLAQEERLASVINDSIAPLLMPDIETQIYRKKELIIINVPHGTGPYFLKSAGPEKGTYVRLGSTNRVADIAALQSLRNFARNISFDELPHSEGKISDLDWDFIKELFQDVDKKITSHNAASLGLITQRGTKEVPSYGGIILFGKNRLKLFPEAIIRCARFAGDTRADIIDQINIETYLPLALEDAIKFIKRNTKFSSEIKSLKRKDTFEYPIIALREALMNAIVHTDYSISGVYISIAIFDDRIEITNPGGLPYGFTLDKALAGASRVRNRVIAKVFYHLKLIEQWGRGLHRIIHACEEKGLIEPKFEELGAQFRVTLYSAKKEGRVIQAWEKDLLKYLKKRGHISTKEAALLWDVTSRAARTRCINLIDAGVIMSEGKSLKDPSSVYVLVDSARKK